MSNPHPLTTHLRKQPSFWQHLPTKAIRIPEVFAQAVINYARRLDAREESLSIPPEPSLPCSPIWLGIKPSLSQLGWAVLEGGETLAEPRLLDYGTIETDSHDPLPQRLAEIAGDLTDLLRQFPPRHVALETPFLNTEYPNGRKLLQVLGVVNATIYHCCRFLPITVYTASWKSHLDSCQATRDDIAVTIESLFNLDHLSRDARVDAIAIAYAAWCGVGF